jgi:hypothetical protein
LRAARWLTLNCTDAQLQNVFNLGTLAEAQALRARLDTKVLKLVAWETERDQMAAAEAVAKAEVGE